MEKIALSAAPSYEHFEFTVEDLTPVRDSGKAPAEMSKEIQQEMKELEAALLAPVMKQSGATQRQRSSEHYSLPAESRCLMRDVSPIRSDTTGLAGPLGGGIEKALLSKSQRNREAARKCRLKKKMKLSELTSGYNRLVAENGYLRDLLFRVLSTTDRSSLQPELERVLQS
eukprot:CAMPEP_0185830788 /NCGR_PEP_ID=MMETSP1353-20130828/1083_1 /TAXON_ID=1077150 /ORGANISM="Erythrolobus australicus, Strain CCMP3124" /LENGTH=170 /DNA_ID=CAMNT_0028528767 /DNA_START=104 /DNA_END=616 /DNA_ORIENTATION=+